MCGIAGFWTSGGLDESARAVLGRMTGAIRHRGPDDTGCWLDERLGLALGHRRLSVIDVSPDGHQPMGSHDGRYIIVFNGEIYNFQDLRAELEAYGTCFRSHSDTEVMLACFEAWGVEAALQKFIGMFAIALWDRKERVLHLIRDRLGVKPLYYGLFGKTLLFGSASIPRGPGRLTEARWRCFCDTATSPLHTPSTAASGRSFPVRSLPSSSAGPDRSPPRPCTGRLARLPRVVLPTRGLGVKPSLSRSLTDCSGKRSGAK